MESFFEILDIWLTKLEPAPNVICDITIPNDNIISYNNNIVKHSKNEMAAIKLQELFESNNNNNNSTSSSCMSDLNTINIYIDTPVIVINDEESLIRRIKQWSKQEFFSINMEKAIQIHRLYHVYTLNNLYEELEVFSRTKGYSKSRQKSFAISTIMNVNLIID